VEPAVAVVDQVARVLAELAQAEDGMGVLELAAAVDLPRSTMSRLLSQMRASGLVERDLMTQRHRPGFLVLEASRRCRGGLTLVDRAERAIVEFSRMVGHTTGISVLDDAEVFEVRGCVGSAPLRVVMPPGKRGPALGTATGRALLAWLDDEAIAHRFSPYPGPSFEASPKNLAELLERLELIRARGWEEAVDELNPGLAAIAVAIEDETTGERVAVYAAVSKLHVPEDERAAIGMQLLDAVAGLGRVQGPKRLRPKRAVGAGR
jgi:DNA-binding IclR family transcriptional regulator